MTRELKAGKRRPGWEGGLLCEDVVWELVGLGQAGLEQGRGGSVKSTQASRRRERGTQRPGS